MCLLTSAGCSSSFERAGVPPVLVLYLGASGSKDNDMASKRPTTIAEYIRAAPREGQPHLRRLYAILKSVAPEAEEAIKWGTPFFVEPRFLFAFSAHKAHCNFAPSSGGDWRHFARNWKSTRRPRTLLQIPYNEPVPEDLVRRIAEFCVRDVSEREDDAFW